MSAKAARGIVLLGGGACSRTSAHLDPKEDFSMARSRKVLTAGAVGVAAMALIAASSSVTGAYFSEAKAGGITGTIGGVHEYISSSTFAWPDMMPGEPRSATVNFTNTGTGAQDFYVVFDNVPALHALNNLGEYGEVHITGGETNNIVGLFDSFNLQDGRHPNTSGNTNSCGNVFVKANPPKDGCWPLPVNLKLASNVAKGGTGSFTFTFNYAGKLGDGTSGGPGGFFNTYPLTNVAKDVYPGSPDAAGPADAGLPFKVLATQVGHGPLG